MSDALEIHVDELPEFVISKATMRLAVAYYGLGRYQEAHQLVEQVDALDGEFETLEFASLHTLQGDVDEAFLWLEKAAKEFPPHLVERHPYFKDIRGGPRWGPVLEQFESQYVESDQ